MLKYVCLGYFLNFQCGWFERRKCFWFLAVWHSWLQWWQLW